MKAVKPKVIIGIANFTDLERIIYIIKPAKKQTIATRVPDANMLFKTKAPVIKNRILSFFSFVVKAKMRNATDVAAALQP
jgi:hypothetical protein